MQRFHRRFHRLLWLIIAPVAVSALIGALLHRPAPAANDSLPEPAGQLSHECPMSVP